MIFFISLNSYIDSNKAFPFRADYTEALNKFQHGVGQFTALQVFLVQNLNICIHLLLFVNSWLLVSQDFLVYISVHDTGIEIPSGYNTKAGTAVWNKAGKKLVSKHK